MGEAQPCRDAATDLALIAYGGGDGAGVLEVLVHHEHAGVIGYPSRTREQLAVIGRRAEEGAGGAVAEYGLAPGAVGAAAAGKVEARNPGVVDAGIGPQHLATIAVDIVGEAEARLPHRLVGGDGSVARKLESTLGIGH